MENSILNPNPIPFELSEIEDVRIIIKVKGKHYSLIANKELEEKEGVQAIFLRKAILEPILKIHDIVTPALEDIIHSKIKF